MRDLFAITYSITMACLWLAGLIAAVWHPSRGPWRRWAVLAFASLFVARLGATAYIGDDILTGGTWDSRSLVLQLLELFQILGVALIIVALLSSRGGRPQAQSPALPDPHRDR